MQVTCICSITRLTRKTLTLWNDPILTFVFKIPFLKHIIIRFWIWLIHKLILFFFKQRNQGSKSNATCTINNLFNAKKLWNQTSLRLTRCSELVFTVIYVFWAYNNYFILVNHAVPLAWLVGNYIIVYVSTAYKKQNLFCHGYLSNSIQPHSH